MRHLILNLHKIILPPYHLAMPISTYLHSQLDRYINEIVELCAQPSVSARGEGIRECADLTAQILSRHGLTVRKFETPGNPILVAQATGQSPRALLFYNHYDVQPPEPLAQWTSPPFEPTLRDGALYARGARDDKGELICRLAAVDAIRATHNGVLPCGVTFVVEGEEEIGSPHIAQFVRDHADLLRSQAAIWEEGGTDGEGRPYTVLGCRGLLYVELAVELLATDAHSGGAHILPNAAWHLLRALSSLKDDAERILIPGFYDQARPPTELDLRLLDAMPDSETQLRENYAVRDFVNGLRGKALNRALFNPTCNIAGLTAGYQEPGLKTIIPARATAKVDFRLVPDQSPDDIFEKLRNHLDQTGFNTVAQTKVAAVWPYKAPADDPFVQLTARAGEAAYGLPYQMSPTAGGTTPVYAFAEPLGGIPVVTAGVGNGNQNRAHAPDEHIRVVDFINAAKQIAYILEGFPNL
jgi:acetylornithine deacetylase/succinyl-diaminopimelate desuccinylase-like protein